MKKLSTWQSCYQAKHSVHNCSPLGKTSSKRKVQKFNKCRPGKSSGSTPDHWCKKSYATFPLTWGEGTFFEKKSGRCMYSILGTITFSMAALHTTSQQGNDTPSPASTRHPLAHLRPLTRDLLSPPSPPPQNAPPAPPST